MNRTLSLLDYAVEAVSQLLTTSPSQRNHAGDGVGGARRRLNSAPLTEGALGHIGSQRSTHFGASIGALGASSAKTQPSIYFAIPLDSEVATI